MPTKERHNTCEVAEESVTKGTLCLERCSHTTKDVCVRDSWEELSWKRESFPWRFFGHGVTVDWGSGEFCSVNTTQSTQQPNDPLLHPCEAREGGGGGVRPLEQRTKNTPIGPTLHRVSNPSRDRVVSSIMVPLEPEETRHVTGDLCPSLNLRKGRKGTFSRCQFQETTQTLQSVSQADDPLKRIEICGVTPQSFVSH